MSPTGVWDSIDRAPIIVGDAILSLLPESWRPIAGDVLVAATVVVVFATIFALLTILERKGLARIQNRPGPNRVGIPFTKIRLGGFGQPIADAIKMILKEDIVPTSADKVLHFIAPVILILSSLLTLAVIPFGRHLLPLELEAAVLYFFAAGAISELAVFTAGWGSHNKYSLVGAMRALAQMLSYELPLVLAIIPVIMLTGTLSTSAIVDAQAGWSLGGFLPSWHVVTPWGFAAFLIFLVSSFAEANRSPFDLPEAESEIIAGHLTEYSGFKYALFFMAEYFGMCALAGLGVTLFLGGWHAPFAALEFLPSWFWFFGKLFTILGFFIWVRGTLPRLRMDQLTRFAWKLMVPLSLCNLANAAFWHLSAGWTTPGGLVLRWVLSIAIIATPFLLLSRSLFAGLGPRTYRYAP
jgi:NADH-quinone oxidoreductase subunit H